MTMMMTTITTMATTARLCRPRRLVVVPPRVSRVGVVVTGGDVSGQVRGRGGDDCEDDTYLKNPLTTYRLPSQYAALRTRDNSVGRARDVAAVAVVVAVLA